MSDAVIGAAAADAPEARWAMSEYFAELDRRFTHGFEVGDALDDAAAAFRPPDGVFLLARRGEEVVGCGGVQRVDGRDQADGCPDARAWGPGACSRRWKHNRRLGATRILDTNGVGRAIAMYGRSATNGSTATPNPYAQLWFAKSLR